MGGTRASSPMCRTLALTLTPIRADHRSILRDGYTVGLALGRRTVGWVLGRCAVGNVLGHCAIGLFAGREVNVCTMSVL